MLKGNSEKEYSCLLSDVSGKILSFSQLTLMLAVSFLQMVFIKLKKFYCSISLLHFYHKWMLDFVKCFSASIVWPCDFSF